MGLTAYTGGNLGRPGTIKRSYRKNEKKNMREGLITIYVPVASDIHISHPCLLLTGYKNIPHILTVFFFFTT